MFSDPKTTTAGLLCIIVVCAYLLHQIPLDACITLLGLCGAAIGIAGKDSTK